jgi:hypothetical protein
MQTLAQAHKWLNGTLPHRHNDALIDRGENNIIFSIEGLYYLTFPQNGIIPCGFEFFCTAQEFTSFKAPPPVFENGQEVFIAQINPLAGVESKRYYHPQFWCDSGHQREYVSLGLLFGNKESAEFRCRELVGLPPLI